MIDASAQSELRTEYRTMLTRERVLPDALALETEPPSMPSLFYFLLECLCSYLPFIPPSVGFSTRCPHGIFVFTHSRFQFRNLSLQILDFGVQIADFCCAVILITIRIVLQNPLIIGDILPDFLYFGEFGILLPHQTITMYFSNPAWFLDLDEFRVGSSPLARKLVP